MNVTVEVLTIVDGLELMVVHMKAWIMTGRSLLNVMIVGGNMVQYEVMVEVIVYKMAAIKVILEEM